MSIHKKILTGFLLISLTCLIIISVSTYYSSKHLLIQQIENQLNSISDNKKIIVQNYIDNQYNQLEIFTSRLLIKRILNRSNLNTITEKDYESANRIMKDTITGTNHINKVTLVNKNGIIVACSNSDDLGKNISNTKIFKHSIKDIILDHFQFDNNKNAVQITATPLVFEENIVGSVIFENKLDSLYFLLRINPGLGQSGEVLLARRISDGSTQFIAPLKYDKHSIFTKFIPKLQQIPINEALIQKEQIITNMNDYRNIPVIASTRYIGKTKKSFVDWGMVVKIDRDEAMKAIYSLRFQLLTIIIFSTIAIIIISYYLSKGIINPIRYLTKTSQVISKGDLSQRVQIISKDEIGILGNSFNHMVDQLESANHLLNEKISELNHDIQIRKQTEDQLHQTLNKLADIHQALDNHAIVAITDAHGKITYANDKFCEISKYPREEIIGKDHNIVNSGYHPKEFFINLWNTIIDGKIWKGEFLNRAKDGSLYWVKSTIYPFLDENKKPYQFIAIRTDITEQKLMEEELKKLLAVQKNIEIQLRDAKDLAEEHNRLKTQFLNNISHEIKTPLNGIMGFTELSLQDNNLNDEHRENLEMIRDSSHLLMALFKNLFDLSEIETGRFHLIYQSFNIINILTYIYKIFNPLAIEKSIELSYFLPPNLNKSYAGDPECITRVLLNLVDNAIKFTQGGKVNLQVDQYSEETDQNYDDLNDSVKLLFKIKDTGIGIQEDLQKIIFDPFRQVDGSETRQYSGLGIGLSTSKRLVNYMGGEIWLESYLNVGTSIYFTVPLVIENTKKTNLLAN